MKLKTMKLKIIMIIIIVFCFYFNAATGGTYNFNLKDNHGGFYNVMVDGFLKGQLNLPIEPDPRMLILSDPYDPNKNNGIRCHDASFYNGKYYSYYGPSAAILLFLPYKILTKRGFPENLSVLIFMFGAFICSVLLIVKIRNHYFSKSPDYILLILITVLGFSNIGLFLLRLSRMYEVAISSALFFFIAGILFIWIGVHSKKTPLLALFFGSLFLGFAIGARPHFVFAGISLLITWIRIIQTKLIEKFKDHFILALTLFMPFIICLLTLCLYNFLRFGDPLNFGHNYVTSCVLNIHKTGYFNIKNFLPNVYLFLFNFPLIDSTIPFIHVNWQIPSFLGHLDNYYFEHTIGLLTGIPFTLLLVLYPATYGLCVITKSVNSFFESSKKFPVFEFLIIFIPCSLTLGVILTSSGITTRYTADYATSFILLAAIVWMYFESVIRTGTNIKSILSKLAIVLAILSIIFGFSYEPYSGCVEREYKLILPIFKPLQKIIFSINPNWKDINLFVKPIPISKITASNSYGDNWRPEKLIDGNLNTDWAVTGTTPATLDIILKTSEKIKSIWLLQRSPHGSFQGWKKIYARFFLMNKLISEKEFYSPNAHKNQIQHINFQPILTDRIEILFIEPVNLKQNGSPVDYIVDSGYNEILLERSDD